MSAARQSPAVGIGSRHVSGQTFRQDPLVGLGRCVQEFLRLQGNLCVMARMQTRLYGVRAADLEAQRVALIEFAAEMYRPLVRCDQRAKGEQYVRGLLLEGRRKSIQPMAARLPDGDEEGLQQFITDSPWDDVPSVGGWRGG